MFTFKDFFVSLVKLIVMLIIKKILMFILVFAILIVLREAFDFFLLMRDVMKNDADRKMEISTTRLIILACAISYIVTIIFTGFNLL